MIPESEYVFTRRKRHFYHCENACILNTRDRRDFSISIILLYSSKNANHAATIVMTIQPLTRTKFSKHSRVDLVHLGFRKTFWDSRSHKNIAFRYFHCVFSTIVRSSQDNIHCTGANIFFVIGNINFIRIKRWLLGVIARRRRAENGVFRVQSKDFLPCARGWGGVGGVFRTWRLKEGGRGTAQPL